MKKHIFVLSYLVLISSLALADSKIVENPSQPYKSLGSLELKISNSHHWIKYLTLGLLRKRAYERMTHELNKKLLKEARNKYGADAIANVTYWPGPENIESVDYFYGRADMVRFLKFPILADPTAGQSAVLQVEADTH